MAPIYQARLKDQAGAIVALFDDPLLSYHRAVNGSGGYTLQLPLSDERRLLFVLDGQLEVWRRDLAAGLAWTLDFEGLHQLARREVDDQGRQLYTSQGVGYADLLRRRLVAACSGSAEADKSGAAETVAKAFVAEQAGSGAGTRALSGLTVQLDAASGATVTMAASYKNLADVLCDIADLAPGAWDVVGTGAAIFQFRWYDQLRGLDRSLTNGVRDPVLFAVEWGNMARPVLVESHLQEANAVYCGGQGQGSAKLVELRTDAAAIAASPWGRREVFRSGGNEKSSAGLQAAADAALVEMAATQDFTFSVLQLDGCRYGLHYGLGDRVTALFDGVQVDRVISAVQVSLTERGEAVEVTLAEH